MRLPLGPSAGTSYAAIFGVGVNSGCPTPMHASRFRREGGLKRVTSGEPNATHRELRRGQDTGPGGECCRGSRVFGPVARDCAGCSRRTPEATRCRSDRRLEPLRRTQRQGHNAALFLYGSPDRDPPIRRSGDESGQERTLGTEMRHCRLERRDCRQLRRAPKDGAAPVGQPTVRTH
jgi:hypothetical protein